MQMRHKTRTKTSILMCLNIKKLKPNTENVTRDRIQYKKKKKNIM